MLCHQDYQLLEIFLQICLYHRVAVKEMNILVPCKSQDSKYFISDQAVSFTILLIEVLTIYELLHLYTYIYILFEMI